MISAPLLSTDFKGRAFHAAPGFLEHLLAELGDDVQLDGEIAIVSRSAQSPFWVRNIWLEPFVATFDSIKDATGILKAIQRNWAPCSSQFVRRTLHISGALPKLPSRPRAFPFTVPDSPMGAFLLLDEHTLLASAKCSSPFPGGEIQFIENHTEPPSRAYLKLWEALTLAGTHPLPGQRCLDAGSSPGGWTWVLAGLGAQVISVDRASIEPRVEALPGVTYMRHNAFTLDPRTVGPIDWLCSDVICYPPALYEWVLRWLESGLVSNFICTIKMQGQEFDRETTEKFAAIPGSRVVHLWHNKHELTWMKIQG